jgi:hypothetical protein
MQLFGRHICRTFENLPVGRLFLFPQLRVPMLGIKVFAVPTREHDRLEGFRPPPPTQNKIGYAILSKTPEVIFNGSPPKLVLDIDDDALIVPELYVIMPKDKDAPGILFLGKDKRCLSVVAGERNNRVVGHIDLGTGEFERGLVMNEELAIADWRVILPKPTDGAELVRYQSTE